MHKVIILAVIAAALTGCQTVITAEKYPENILPIQEKVTVNGSEQVIATGYLIASGGWSAKARSPLYASEALNGLEIGIHTNGSVTLSLEKYQRDLSTNSVVMVKEMFQGGTQLVTAIGEAYVKIAGGGAQAAAATDVATKVYTSFKTAGGDATKASVTTVGDTVKVSDGSVYTTCTADGTCTNGSCSD